MVPSPSKTLSVLAVLSLIGTTSLSGSPAPGTGPLKVFLLAGDANMQGKGLVELPSPPQPPGSLRQMVESNKEQHGALLNPRGDWLVRDDAWIWMRQGNSPPPAADEVSMGELGVAFGATSDNIGPEFGFGHALADHFKETVVLIKTSWGDSSLYQDFRPPSAVSKRGGTIGPCFTRMIESFKDAQAELKKKFPDREIQLAGFGWHQGVGDRMTDLRANEYAANLDDLIKDVRAALGSPNLPVVIASSSMGETWNLSSPEGAQATAVENAQLALDGQPNISVVYTRPLYYPAAGSPASDPTHWNQNGESLYLIGSYMGRRMIQLCAPVQSPPPSPSPPAAPSSPPKVATTPAPKPSPPSAPPSEPAPKPRPPGSVKSLVYEPFDYPIGGLNGANGGLGFDGPWTAAPETKVTGGSPGYGSTPILGNSIGDLGPNVNRFGGTRKISPDALVGQGLLADGATLWLSAVVGYEEKATLTNSYLLLALANHGFNPGAAKSYIDDEGSQRGAGVGMWLGKSGQYMGKITPAHFRDLSQGTDRKAWIAIPKEPPINLFNNESRFRLIAMKFTWGAKTDTIDLYAPKTDLLLPSAPYASLSATVDQSAFDTLTWTRADKVILDEIRFGPTYESVGGSVAK